jgi:Mn-containing catalase
VPNRAEPGAPLFVGHVGRWTEGQSIDGNGTFSLRPMEPEGREPDLGPARAQSGAQSAQIKG